MTESSYVSRINQIDAAQLDAEIYKILKLKTQELTELCPQEKVEEWQSEIDAFLKFVVWSFSLGSGKSTFGQRLLDLNYANLNKRKAVLFLILNILPLYLKEKLSDRRRAGVSTSRSELRNCVETMANIFSLLNFLNLALFLHRGKQMSIVERILGIWSENSTLARPRQIGYTYMTRELLWHGLMELFSVGLPMINFHSVKQTIARFWTKKWKNREITHQILYPRMDMNTRCPYCDESPILPRFADCEHLYCYYCMKAHFAAMNEFQCTRCGTELHSQNIRTYVPNQKPNVMKLIDEESES